MPEIGMLGLTRRELERAYGSRTAARSESDGESTGPYLRRASSRPYRRAGGGNVPTGFGLRPGAKAPDEPPTPTGYAPPLDSTCP